MTAIAPSTKRTTDTEDWLRGLEFRPGLPMSQVISHDAIKVIASAIDEDRPVLIETGDIYHDMTTDRHLVVQSIDNGLVSFATVQMDGSLIGSKKNRFEVVNSVRAGRLIHKTVEK